MLTRKVLLPGKDYIHQLNLILCFCGTPSEKYLATIGSESVLSYIRKLKKFQPADKKTVFPNASTEAL
eukprot:Pgem_evm1s15095